MDTRRIPHAGVTKTVIVYVPFHSPTFEEVALKVTTVTRDDLLMSPDTLAFGTVTKGKGAKVYDEGHVHQRPELGSEEGDEHRGVREPGVQARRRAAARTVTYDVTATLDKDCPAGNWTSDIYLETSNAAVAKLRIPVTVNVVAPVAAKPEAVSFGNVKMGSSPEQKVTIQSATPFKILAVKGTDEQLTVKVDKDAAQAVHTVVIAASPKATGGFTRTVEIVTDNKDQPSMIVPVTAKVVEK